MAELSEYQRYIMELLADGWRLERRVRPGGLGQRWPFVVLVDSSGRVGRTVRGQTVQFLFEAGVLAESDIVDVTEEPTLPQIDVSNRGRVPSRGGGRSE
jgi:hypothetical protein